MRYELSNASIKEAFVHPVSVFEQEQKLSRQFVELQMSSDRMDMCPVSGQERIEILFDKWGQQYALCPDTWSLSLAQLPNEAVLDEYFYHSELAQYRATEDYQNVVSDMRNELWEDQIQWIEGRIRRYLGMGTYQVSDWGSKASGWVDMLRHASFTNGFSIREPLAPVIEEPSDIQSDLVCLMDVIQRKTNPRQLLKDVHDRLRPDGLLIITCRSGSGFDILTLKEHSESIFPFDHICLPSPKGMRMMLEETGYQVLELTTPGLLDASFVKSHKDKLAADQYFQRYLMESDDMILERLQTFLQLNNLSSHLRVVARKMGES